MAKYDEAIRVIDYYEKLLHRARSAFPHLAPSFTGGRKRTPPYYREKGFDFETDFPKNPDKSYIKEFNETGHWINQSFIVRLYAVLEEKGVFCRGKRCKPDTSLPGGPGALIFRKLRNVYAHEDGLVKKQNKAHQQIRELMAETYQVKSDQDDFFDIPIDGVLAPMVKDLKKYAKAVLSSQRK